MTREQALENAAKLKAHIGNIAFNDPVEAIVNEIVDLGCDFFAITHKENYYTGPPLLPAIGIPIAASDNPKVAFWNLLHEFGHLKDPDQMHYGKEKYSGQKDQREMKAWRIADEIFLQYPQLKPYQKEYVDFRTKCLATYDLEDSYDNPLVQ